MIPMTLEELAHYSGGILTDGHAETRVTEIVTDTRKIKPGSLFVALKGERFDGHAFVGKAFEQGAVAALVSDSYQPERPGRTLIRVSDPLLALGQIACAYRKQYYPALRRIAVTGSVGKTSTKDMIDYVLSGSFRTRKTPMNFNNEIGLPMTVLSLQEDDQLLITEMGMRGFGQIQYLTEIVEQEMTVITNIGTAHLELLGSRENILRAKMEACIAGRNAKANRPYRLIVNGDNAYLKDVKLLKQIAREYGCEHLVVLSFGFDVKCAYRATDYRTENGGVAFTLLCDRGHFTVKLPVLGEHNVYNALAAIACACACGISVETAVARLSTWGEDAIRQRIVRLGALTVLDDTYNASPESVEASLKVLAQLDAEIRVAVLGDMLELGTATESGHTEAGKLAGKLTDTLIAVGQNAVFYQRGFWETAGREAARCENAEAAIPMLIPLCREAVSAGKKIAVLVKGSHAMHMETVTTALTEEFKES